MQAIKVNAAEQETATWTISGLIPGYYRVDAIYPQNAGNAKHIQVLYQTSSTNTVTKLSNAWKLAGTLDESKGGTPISTKKTADGSVEVYKTLTPFHVDSAMSYIWVEPKMVISPIVLPGENGYRWYYDLSPTNSVTIRLVSTPGIPDSGRFVADAIQLTLIGTTK